MARPTREPTLPSPLAPAIARHVRAHGGDASLLLLRAGEDPGIEPLDESPVSMDTLAALLEAASEALGDPFLALRLPDELPFRRYALADLAARASATVREALSGIARHAGTIHPRYALALEEDALEGRFVLRTPGRPRGYGRHVHEYALALALAHIRRETRGELDPSRVWFAHARPRDLAPLHRYFGTREVSFGCADSGFALPPSVLDAATHAGDPRLLATIDALGGHAQAASPSPPRAFNALVAARVRANLPSSASVDAVARSLRLSPRTLQRRLESEGSSFSEVLDTVREQLARAWVTEPDGSLGDVAARLGFADVATFGRAFKRWTGVAPGRYRTLARGA